MHIGLDARLLYYRQGGIASYISHLIESLAKLRTEEQFTIFYNRRGRERLAEKSEFSHRSLWTPCHHRLEQWTLPLELLPAGIDLLHSPDFIPPIHRRCKAVITVHDLAFLHFPELLTRESRGYYEQIAQAAESADGIIAVSESTRRDMTKLLGTPPERVEVIHHAPEKRFSPLDNQDEVETFVRQKGLPSKFMLWVGTLEPRKNLPTLLRALALLRDKGWKDDYTLVAVGSKGWLHEPILSLVEELGLEGQVRFFGPTSTDNLLLLYNSAWLFVFPSLYEGFGFPPLEAMACGTPVISANTSSLPEVLGNAAIHLDPLDEGAWADTIKHVAEDKGRQEELRRRGLEQAAKFTWDTTARKTLALYQRIGQQ